MTLETCRGVELIVYCSILLPHSVPASTQYCSSLPLQVVLIIDLYIQCISLSPIHEKSRIQTIQDTETIRNLSNDSQTLRQTPDSRLEV